MSGVFLTSLMEYLGISDGAKGVISTFGSLGALAQLLSVKLSGLFTKNKLFVCFTISQKLWLSFIYFIPFLSLRSGAARLWMILAYCFSQLCIQVGMPAITDWVASLVPERFRGRYLAKKEAVLATIYNVSNLAMGVLMDILENINILYAFLLLGTVVGIFMLINLIAFLKMKEPKSSVLTSEGKEAMGRLARRNAASAHRHQTIRLLAETREAFSAKSFRQLFLLNCLWLTASNIAGPFNYSYQLKELGLSYTYIMVVICV